MRLKRVNSFASSEHYSSELAPLLKGAVFAGNGNLQKTTEPYSAAVVGVLRHRIWFLSKGFGTCQPKQIYPPLGSTESPLRWKVCK
jgi:hypothetical protein